MRIQNSFILAPGIGEKTEKKIWKRGIKNWREFESTHILNGKRDRLLDFIQKARRNLEVGNTVFFNDKLPSNSRWRLYRNFETETAFFDIETTGLSSRKHEVTTVSFHRNGETRTLVKDEDLTRGNLKKELFKSKLLVSFNGKRFDQPFLEKNFDLEIETPHLDLMYPCRYLGLTGGLKKIEKELGIDRSGEDLDGSDAVRLWKKYQRGHREALGTLIEYNRYDTRNLENLLEYVHSRLTREKFRRHFNS